MDKWFIFVSAGKWQSHSMQVAKEMGLKIIGLDSNPSAEGQAFCDLFITTDIFEINENIKKLKELSLNYVGVASICSEVGMSLASHIRGELSLSGPNVELTKLLTDKILQRQCWKANKFKQVEFITIEDYKYENDEAKEITDLNYPLIVKPADSSGSRGVTVVEEYDKMKSAIRIALLLSKSKRVIIEEYMIGEEFTVETFGNGESNILLCITRKKKLQSTKNTVAYELETVDKNSDLGVKIKNQVLTALNLLCYKFGPGHTEVIVQDNGEIGIVEVAGRGGGFNLFDQFIPLVSGFPIVKNTLLQLIGEEIEIGEVKNYFGILKFFPSKAGRIYSIRGFDKVKNYMNVLGLPFYSEGQEISDAKSDGDRMGYLLSWGDDPQIVKKNILELEQCIDFQVR